jgi:hypothetical protein
VSGVSGSVNDHSRSSKPLTPGGRFRCSGSLSRFCTVEPLPGTDVLFYSPLNESKESEHFPTEAIDWIPFW